MNIAIEENIQPTFRRGELLRHKETNGILLCTGRVADSPLIGGVALRGNCGYSGLKEGEHHNSFFASQFEKFYGTITIKQ